MLLRRHTALVKVDDQFQYSNKLARKKLPINFSLFHGNLLLENEHLNEVQLNGSHVQLERLTFYAGYTFYIEHVIRFPLHVAKGMCEAAFGENQLKFET